MRNGRNVPAMIVAIMGGLVVSMLAGLLLASYATAGVTPVNFTARQPRMARVVEADQNRFAQLTTVQQIAARVGEARPADQDW
jgi:hypothetical protein